MYDIENLKRKMLVKYPFFGSVIAGVSYKEDKSFDTAATDGKTIYYNPDFLNSISIGQQVFVLAHEVAHIALNHILRSEGKIPRLWNIATDAIINSLLEEDKLEMPAGAVNIEDAIKYDAEDLYNKLLQEEQEKKQNNKQQNGSGQGNQSQETSKQDDFDEEDQNQEVGHDTHRLWPEAVKKHKEGKSNNNSEDQSQEKQQQDGSNQGNQSQETQQQDGSGEEDQSELEKQQKEFEKLGEKEVFRKNRELKKQQLEELKKAIQQSVLAGSSPSNGIRTVSDIGISKPIIDWRYALRETINYNIDWSYKNATIEDGVLTAHLEELPTPETEIVIDTSGSVDTILLKNFLKECKNIMAYSKLKVGCFDTKFHGFQEIRTQKDIENMEFYCGGGTDFNVAVNAFTNRVENKIIFTDGEALMPEKAMDVIWIVYGNRKINPKGGKVIQITDEQLDKLISFEADQSRTR